MEWAACGGKVTDHYGELKSPQLYLSHILDMTCVYTIEPQDVQSFFVQYSSEFSQTNINGVCDNALQVNVSVAYTLCYIIILFELFFSCTYHRYL